MNIKECVDFINFWIRKERGAFYTIEESIEVIDRGQVSYYNDIMPKYAVSQIIKDTLSPFKTKHLVTTLNTASGLITIPNLFLATTVTANASSVGTIINVSSTAALLVGQVVVVNTGTGLFQPSTTIIKILSSTSFQVNIDPITVITSGATIRVYNAKYYLDLLDVQIEFTDSGHNVFYPIKMINEDERGDRLNSQIDPPTITAPVGEIVSLGQIQLYPKVDSYTGTVSYMRRPVKPLYDYSVVGGRVIVYNPSGSIQLEWRDTDINAILLKALSSIGINLSDQEGSQFAEAKSQENYQGVNHL